MSMPEHKPSETLILLAEDDLMIRNLVTPMLSKKGYGVLVAVNGKEALELLEQSRAPVDLLITDVKMPIMDGIALAKTVRERRPEVKIIVISGQMDEQIRKGNTLDAFLQKPFVPSHLLKSIQEVLDKEQQGIVEV